MNSERNRRSPTRLAPLGIAKKKIRQKKKKGGGGKSGDRVNEELPAEKTRGQRKGGGTLTDVPGKKKSWFAISG